MDTEKTIREQLLDLLGGVNAHMDFDEAVDRFPIKAGNSRPPNSDYTPWRLLEHMRIAQWDILESSAIPNMFPSLARRLLAPRGREG